MTTDQDTKLTAIYNATANITGDATATDVLTGKTFSSATAGTGISGTMTNNGAWTGTVTPDLTAVTIPAGYHNGSGYVNTTINNIPTLFQSAVTMSPQGDPITRTFNCTSLRNYQKATIDNFLLVITYIYAGSSGNSYGTGVTKSYNASTGVLTLTSGDLTNSSYFNIDIYYYYTL
jgi:hypothetical protein